MAAHTLDILLIEDDIDDVDLLKEAFENNSIPFELKLIMEGDKVSPYLEKCLAVPEIIVMDLNLPKTDGKQIMKEIKSSGKFRNVPLVVLSTSSSKEDIDYSYLMGAKKFITKPITMDGWDNTVITIAQLARGPVS